ncbi:lycopene cyclase [Altericroceibacterium spongiae]|uniref:Lycopene cyclase n=1 Tax=Altericroceibacterium spongiae TaxID=2320269 RepID=A0A420EC38_9SPHN|nr:lycopene beta-cyclase CrtY [Altericroceibacterium spongiae]RKF18202.1 lycopene cyclase [Altericroceibacterium spongiae]
MTNSSHDVLILGGGLSGGLIALALHQHRPGLSVCLVESEDRLGGQHRWSWFASDLGTAGTALMDHFPLHRWDDGYDVRFPRRERHLATPYRSLASADFDRTLRAILPADALYCGIRATEVEAGRVTLENGKILTARAVIDCRGQVESDALECGYQLFHGHHIRTVRPHGLTRPLIMDATVRQHDGYRFVYSLPLGPQDIFIEDTYYADRPLLDRETLWARLETYAQAHEWQGETLSEESGILPVITGGDFDRFQRDQRIPGVAVAGMRGGFSHPLTSYSLPLAAANAIAIALATDCSGPALAVMLEHRAQRHWRDTAYYRLLGKMLFQAAEPQERYRVFEHFYSMPETLIERFYAARSTRVDRLRILCGKPPVPVSRALLALLKQQAGTVERQDA